MCTLFFGGIMDLKYFDIAFKCANKAYCLGEIPIGAVIVKNDKVISYGYNKKEMSNDVLGHAELIAIKKAEKKLKNWRLDGCDIYVTLDPCPMCASAIKQSRISNVYSALHNSYVNNTKIITEIFAADNTNPSVGFFSDFAVSRSKSLLASFFKSKR